MLRTRKTGNDQVLFTPIRNLHDVFGENDTKRRRATIDEVFTEDCAFSWDALSAQTLQLSG